MIYTIRLNHLGISSLAKDTPALPAILKHIYLLFIIIIEKFASIVECLNADGNTRLGSERFNPYSAEIFLRPKGYFIINVLINDFIINVLVSSFCFISIPICIMGLRPRTLDVRI